MKIQWSSLSILAAILTLALAGCTPPPLVKTIAGVSVPKLETNRITGIWLSGGNDKGVIATRIKDGDAGLVEMASLEAKPDNISLHRFDAILRDSPAGLLWNVNEQSFAEPADKKDAGTNEMFGRVVITDEHLLVFLPDTEALKDLAKRGLIKVSYAKNDKGEDTGAPILEALGKEEFAKIETNGVNPALMFQTDPAFVFVRLNKKD